MPPRTKMEKIRGKGKVSPLEPKARKKEPTTKKKVVAKKKPDAKAPAKKVAKKVAKATAKKTVVPIATRGFIRTMLGFGSRVVAPVALAVGALPLVDPVMSHLFPKSEPWKSTPKLRASQKRMNKAIDKMGGKQTPQQQIHGGGYFTGLQPDKTKAVSPLTLTGDVKVAPEGKKKESTLGKTKSRLTRPKKEVYTTKLRIPPELPEIKSGGTVPDRSKAVALKSSPSLNKPINPPKNSDPKRINKEFTKALAAGHGIYEAEGGGTVEAKTDPYGRTIDNFLKGLLPDFLGPLKKAKGKRIIR